MTDTTIVTEIAELRQRFEAWCDDERIDTRRSDVNSETYFYPNTVTAWRAWQSSASRALPAAPDVGDEKPVCPTCKGVGLIGGLVRYGDGDVDSVHEPCPDCAFPAAWMSPDHIAAFQRVEKGMAWASTESTEFYSTALYTAEQVARIREQARRDAIAECLTAVEKSFAGYEPDRVPDTMKHIIKTIEALAEAKS